jgi:hypothetical protein
MKSKAFIKELQSIMLDAATKHDLQKRAMDSILRLAVHRHTSNLIKEGLTLNEIEEMAQKFGKPKLKREPEERQCVHTEHCCRVHGCKYSDEYCPVVLGEKSQSYLCEVCHEDYGEPLYQLCHEHD